MVGRVKNGEGAWFRASCQKAWFEADDWCYGGDQPGCFTESHEADEDVVDGREWQFD